MRLYVGPRLILSDEFSIYLNFLRATAALSVLLGHMKQDGLGMGWNPLSQFSHEGVIIFFVLSGFIICHTTLTKKRDVWDYFVARLSRLYSVVVPSILFCSLLTIILGIIIHDPATAFSNYQDFTLFDFTGQLLFLSESWFGVHLIPMNSPYWSLCYEFWYYVLFGIVCFWRGWSLVAWFCFAMVISGAAILALAPIWAAGAWYALAGERFRFARPLAVVVYASSIFVLVTISYSGADVSLKEYLHENIPGFWRLSSSQRVLTDYVLGTVMVLHLIAARSLLDDLGPILRALRKPIEFVASFSFTLYMFHRPLTQIGGWAFRLGESHVLGSLIATTIILGSCYLISLGTEQKLNWWRASIEGVIRRFQVADAAEYERK